MYKKYNLKTKNLERVLSVEDPEMVETRTKALLQWINFNKRNPQDMAMAILKMPKFLFLMNCELLVDDSVECRGKTFKPYCYKWKTEYFELVDKARQLYWKYIESKS